MDKATFLVLICWVTLSAAQRNGSCEAYNPSLPSTSKVCSPFISSQIFIANDTTQTSLDFQLFQSTAFVQLLQLQSILPLNCYRALASFICKSAFPSCNPQNSPSPIYPCESSCKSTLDMCDSTWTNTNIPPINCSSPTAVIGTVGEWSNTCTNLEIPTSSLAAYTGPSVSSCPSVYALRANPADDQAYCSLRCPDPGYTDNEFRTAATANIVISVICTTMMIYLLFSYIIDVHKRQFPTRIQKWLCITVLGVQISLLLSGSNPAKSTMCSDSTTFSSQNNNSTCATQAFALVFFTLASVLWALVMSFIIYVCVVQEIGPQKLQRYEKYFHLFVWGISGTFAVALAGTQSLNYGFSTRIYCFIKVDTSKRLSIDYELFYIPLSIICGLVIILFLLSIRKIITYRVTHKTSMASDVVDDVTTKVLRRIIAVIVVVLVVVAMLSFRFSTSKEAVDRAISERSEWVNCKVRAELLGLPYPSECDTDINPRRRAFGIVVFQNAALSTLGLWIFLAFGTDMAILKQWTAVVKSLFKDKSDFWSYILHGYSSSSSDLSEPNSIHFSSVRET